MSHKTGFLNIISVFLVLSCSVPSKVHNADVGDKVTVLQDEMSVVLEAGDKVMTFDLKPLLCGFDSLYPVLSRETLGSYDRSLLPEENYRYWERLSSYLLRKYAGGGDVLFTVPGKMIACMQERCDVVDMKPYPDCAISGYGKYTDRYFRIDADSRPSLVLDNPERYVFRTVRKDCRHRMLVAIDRFYIGQDRMLCLVYVCSGNYDYASSEGMGLHYMGSSRFFRFNALDNLPMSFEYFYKYCDPVSIGLLENNK